MIVKPMDRFTALVTVCVAEEELEPLESPPPAPMILCCEWLLLKMCGYSREERDTEQLHHADTGAKRKRKL